MSGKEIIGLRSAAKIAGVSAPTMGEWCEKHDIGTRRNGVWHVDAKALKKLLRDRARAFVLLGRVDAQ